MRIIKLSSLTILAACLFVACDNKPKFTVEGTIEGAKGETVYLERRGFSDITVVDSSKVGDDGSFSIKSLRPDYPDLYLLKLGNQSINLSVDSTETIQIKGNKSDFATNFTVSGSDGTNTMKEVVLAKAKLVNTYNELKKQYDNKSLSGDDFIAEFQKAVNEYKDFTKKAIIANLKSPAAYFALFQQMEDALIIDPYQKEDAKIYSAVATSWDMYYKNNPRAKHLRDFTLQSISTRRRAEKGIDIEAIPSAESSAYYAIELPDINNNIVSLSSLKGKVTLLDFTSYREEFSPAHNMALNKLYEKYNGKLNIYQVSFDTDIHFWQNAASNLPWVAVRDADFVNSGIAIKFNIQNVPTSFILNAQGEIVKRLLPSDDIDKEIQKVL